MSTPKKTAIVPTSPMALAGLVERSEQTIKNAEADNTRKAYASDRKLFAAWCAREGLPSAEPGTIALYLRFMADQGRMYATIERALASICSAYTRAGHPSPWGVEVVAKMLKGLARELGTRPKNRKRAADDDILRRLVGVMPTSGLLGLRDRAMLLLGWCAALRRSELVALDVPHVTPAPKGLVVLVVKSKTDQQGAGEEVPVFVSNDEGLCPVHALDAWKSAAGIVEGAIFRQLGRRQQLGERLTPETVLDRVKHYAKLAKLTPKDFGAHSLRRGFITTAARRGRDIDSIMRTSRHRSVDVAREYIEVATLFERGAGEGLL